MDKQRLNNFIIRQNSETFFQTEQLTKCQQGTFKTFEERYHYITYWNILPFDMTEEGSIKRRLNNVIIDLTLKHSINQMSDEGSTNNV